MSELQYITEASQLQKFHTHRRILQPCGIYYYSGRNGDFSARQLTPVSQDATPGWTIDVYYSVFPLAQLSGKRGRNDDVWAAGGVYAEFDAKDFKEFDSEETLAAAKLAALAHIRSLPFAPSALVDSGGGFHAYWYFAEPVVFETDDDRRLFAVFLERWVSAVGGDESAKDLARVLRVPGTYNGKKKYADLLGKPPAVYFAEFHPDRRYAFEKLKSFAFGHASPPSQNGKRRHTSQKSTQPITQPSLLPNVPAVRNFNRTQNIEYWLAKAGCEKKRNNRWVTPQSTTGQSSILVNDRVAFAFSPKNPLGRPGVITPADLALVVDYNGDVEAFLKALEEEQQFDYETLMLYAVFGDYEAPLRLRLSEIAEQEAQNAAKATALFAQEPTERNERLALRAQRRAEKAQERATGKIKSDANRRRLMAALLDKFKDDNSTSVRCSMLELAARANMSKPTVLKLLAELEGWFVTVDRKERQAPLLTLARFAAETAERIRSEWSRGGKGEILHDTAMRDDEHTKILHDTCDVDAHVLHSNQCSTDIYVKHAHEENHVSCKKISELLKIDPAALPCGIDELAFVLCYDHDAFALSMSTLRDTDEERLRVGEVTKAIRDGSNITEERAAERSLSDEAAESVRAKLAAGYYTMQQRRLVASYASPGPRALFFLSYLQCAGGEATLDELAQYMETTTRSLETLAVRLAFCNVVDVVEDESAQQAQRRRKRVLRVTLNPDWLEQLNAHWLMMPTAGLRAKRSVQWLDCAILYQRQKIERVTLEKNATIERINFELDGLTEFETKREEISRWAFENLPRPMAKEVCRTYTFTFDKEKTRQKVRFVRAAKLGQKDKIAEIAKRIAELMSAGFSKAEAYLVLESEGIAAHVLEQARRYVARYLPQAKQEFAAAD
ncbi:MAG: hypothetical protein KatS3mg038_1534 [Candidatus Kapaibacterium sp.]|nr:MAG: hypothetical protein KatS3mg038_1534 [Candidatus Kapabacteria bacterium]